MPKNPSRCPKPSPIRSSLSKKKPAQILPCTVFFDHTTVTLTSRTADAVIRYTLDGTDPTETSAVYEKPFDLRDSAVLKARAWKTGMQMSHVAQEKFKITDGPVPANPSPDAATGDPPFTVFPEPNPNWTPPPKKEAAN